MKLSPEVALSVGRDAEEALRRSTFDRFAQERLQACYRLAGIILRDPVEAEDAVHDAVVQAWLHWGELRDRSRLDAWLDRILINVCRARIRRRRIGPLDLEERGSGSGSDPFARVPERERLHDALTRMDADHRIVVVLRYAADLTPREIAVRIGKREGTVKSRLHYGLRQLRAILDATERKEGDS
jgi:RNA polymerase sigma-70 factor (ECF subfamily)